jgi:hypothetical protein
VDNDWRGPGRHELASSQLRFQPSRQNLEFLRAVQNEFEKRRQPRVSMTVLINRALDLMRKTLIWHEPLEDPKPLSEIIQDLKGESNARPTAKSKGHGSRKTKVDHP